jgi:hypothetical protein
MRLFCDSNRSRSNRHVPPESQEDIHGQSEIAPLEILQQPFSVKSLVLSFCKELNLDKDTTHFYILVFGPIQKTNSQ